MALHMVGISRCRRFDRPDGSPQELCADVRLNVRGAADLRRQLLRIRIHEITEMQVAGCFRIADKELVEACNQALADMKADGTLYDLAVKYLSQDVADSLDVFTK